MYDSPVTQWFIDVLPEHDGYYQRQLSISRLDSRTDLVPAGEIQYAEFRNGKWREPDEAFLNEFEHRAAAYLFSNYTAWVMWRGLADPPSPHDPDTCDTYRLALASIAEWKLPMVQIGDGSINHMDRALGSQGEQQYIQQLARDALKGIREDISRTFKDRKLYPADYEVPFDVMNPK